MNLAFARCKVQRVIGGALFGVQRSVRNFRCLNSFRDCTGPLQVVPNQPRNKIVRTPVAHFSSRLRNGFLSNRQELQDLESDPSNQHVDFNMTRLFILGPEFYVKP
ncbi:hypothetical protein HAX54_052687 [Datura stramonium]|uniref:Uncharacterized protein n=1 Tax=Datura stramonium TaxID=4076 RepID=A0ABS8T160_DATST|nr:hypothetical protein [Datura stramonium]